MRNAKAILVGAMIAGTLLLSSCSSGSSGHGETVDTLKFEWVDTGTGKPVLCVGEGYVGLDCNWEAYNQ